MYNSHRVPSADEHLLRANRVQQQTVNHYHCHTYRHNPRQHQQQQQEIHSHHQCSFPNRPHHNTLPSSVVHGVGSKPSSATNYKLAYNNHQPTTSSQSIISSDSVLSLETNKSRLRWIISLGLLLPTLAAVIGVVAWAVSTELVMNGRREFTRVKDGYRGLDNKYNIDQEPRKSKIVYITGNDATNGTRNGDFFEKRSQLVNAVNDQTRHKHDQSHLIINPTNKNKQIYQHHYVDNMKNQIQSTNNNSSSSNYQPYFTNNRQSVVIASRVRNIMKPDNFVISETGNNRKVENQYQKDEPKKSPNSRRDFKNSNIDFDDHYEVDKADEENNEDKFKELTMSSSRTDFHPTKNTLPGTRTSSDSVQVKDGYTSKRGNKINGNNKEKEAEDEEEEEAIKQIKNDRKVSKSNKTSKNGKSKSKEKNESDKHDESQSELTTGSKIAQVIDELVAKRKGSGPPQIVVVAPHSDSFFKNKIKFQSRTTTSTTTSTTTTTTPKTTTSATSTTTQKVKSKKSKSKKKPKSKKSEQEQFREAKRKVAILNRMDEDEELLDDDDNDKYAYEPYKEESIKHEAVDHPHYERIPKRPPPQRNQPHRPPRDFDHEDDDHDLIEYEPPPPAAVHRLRKNKHINENNYHVATNNNKYLRRVKSKPIPIMPPAPKISPFIPGQHINDHLIRQMNDNAQFLGPNFPMPPMPPMPPQLLPPPPPGSQIHPMEAQHMLPTFIEPTHPKPPGDKRAILDFHLDDNQPAESHRHKEPDKGITLHFGGGPVGGGSQVMTNPMGILKTLLLPILPKPRVNLNGKVVFGVVLENGVRFGKEKKKKPVPFIPHPFPPYPGFIK